jgi:hypothetical protein
MSVSSKAQANVVRSYVHNVTLGQVQSIVGFIAARTISKDKVLVAKVEALRAAAEDIINYIDSRFG